jgi:hypothetical protein
VSCEEVKTPHRGVFFARSLSQRESLIAPPTSFAGHAGTTLSAPVPSSAPLQHVARISNQPASAGAWRPPPLLRAKKIGFFG